MATDDSFASRLGLGQKPKSSILQMLDADPEVLTREPASPVPASPAASLAGLGELTLLPQAGDPYVAHARQSVGSETTLFCIDRDGNFEGFAWNTYDRIRLVKPELPGGGPVLVVRFYGSEITEVSIEGRNLDALRVFLGQCRVMWIRELGEAKAFGLGASEAVITRLTIRPVNRDD